VQASGGHELGQAPGVVDFAFHGVGSSLVRQSAVKSAGVVCDG
jgi:hypothetical protein